MSENNENNTSTQIASLSNDNEYYGKSLLQDSMERLARNRFAVIGLIIIILNILMAIFAPFLAPRGYADQILEDNNAAPEWVIALFPILDARDAIWEMDRIEGGEIVTETGQELKEGDLIVSFDELTVSAPLDGIVFANEFRIDLFPADMELPQYDISSADNVAPAFTPIRAGDVIFDDVTSPVQGMTYLAGDTLYVLPRLTWRSDQGEAVVETGDVVEAGDVVMIADDGTELTAPLPGTIQAARTGVKLYIFPVERISVPEDVEFVNRPGRSGTEVAAGDVFFGDVSAPIDGLAYLNEDEIIIFRLQNWELGAGIPIIENGQMVSANEALIDYSPLNVYANMDGTVLINDEAIRLSPLEVTSFDLSGAGEFSTTNGQEVATGDVMFGTEAALERGWFYFNGDTGYFAPYNTGYMQVRNEYPLGADYLGRDMLSRLIYGSRVSLAVAFVGPLVATILGVTIGLVSGYFSGWVDNVIMRIVDIFYAFPTLLLIILMMAYFRSGAFSSPDMEGTIGYYMFKADESLGGMLFIFIGIGITSWIGLARLTRGQVLSARENDYVLAARALGASNYQIIWKHVLPNVAGPLIVAETLTIPGYIRSEAFLSFIGLGVNPPTPSWGEMISRGAQTISTYPFQAIFPALALFIIMFAFNFLGDGLRDAFDPRLRGVD